MGALSALALGLCDRRVLGRLEASVGFCGQDITSRFEAAVYKQTPVPVLLNCLRGALSGLQSEQAP
jgi:hypothetical protein